MKIHKETLLIILSFFVGRFLLWPVLLLLYIYAGKCSENEHNLKVGFLKEFP
jgi:hypothetical protein